MNEMLDNWREHEEIVYLRICTRFDHVSLRTSPDYPNHYTGWENGYLYSKRAVNHLFLRKTT